MTRQHGGIQGQAPLPLKAAVVGAGAMGYNHIRIYSQLPQVELVAVVEPLLARADAIAAQFRVPVFSNVTQMLRQVRPDLASVAVPTRLHCTIAVQLLQAGVDVLLEKPITAKIDEARNLVEIGRQSEAIFGIGHVERFNPGVVALKRQLEENALGKISSLKARRLGMVPTRRPDSGVTLDLATHDLDVLLWLLGTLPLSLSSQLLCGVQTPYDDRLEARLEFPAGIEATLVADWLSTVKTRNLTVTGEKGCLSLNYITQELSFYPTDCVEVEQKQDLEPGKPSKPPAFLTAEPGGGKSTALSGPGSADRTGRFETGLPEPLYRELATFVECSANHRPFPVSPEAGLRAVYLAELLLQAGKSKMGPGLAVAFGGF